MADALEGILTTHTCLYASFDRSPDAGTSVWAAFGRMASRSGNLAQREQWP
jgi:hypothetical protein